MSKQYYPVLFMLSSTFSLSLTGLFSKYLGEYFHVNLLTFLRFLVPAILLIALSIHQKARWPNRAEQKYLWLRSVCISACQFCFIYALQHLTLVESMVLFGTGPLFIPLLEKLIFSVRISIANAMALVVTFIGVTLLAGDHGGFNIRPELLVGLAAGFFNAGSQLTLYRVSHSRLNAVEINLWTFLFASVVLTPMVMVNLTTEELFTQKITQPEILVLALGALSVLIINTQVFRAKAYKFAQSGSQLAPLIFTSLIFSALWQVIFYDETYNFYQIFGLVLILGANILGLSVNQWKQHRDLSVRAL